LWGFGCLEEGVCESVEDWCFPVTLLIRVWDEGIVGEAVPNPKGFLMVRVGAVARVAQD
jgi:hypothetical protein